MSPSEIRLGFATSEKRFICVGAALVGLALGAVAPFLARWAADQPWVPMQGPLRLVASFDSSWAVWGRPLIGLALGLAFAAYVIHQSPVLTMTPEQIVVSERGTTRRIARTDVAGVYRRGGKVVVENERGRRLFAGEVEGGKTTVREAFVTLGYPWEAE